MYLLKRLRGRQINSIKIFAGEILSVILQNSDENRKKVGEADGVDILLKQLANFKKKDPKEYFFKKIARKLCSVCKDSLLRNVHVADKFILGDLKLPHLISEMISSQSPDMYQFREI